MSGLGAVCCTETSSYLHSIVMGLTKRGPLTLDQFAASSGRSVAVGAVVVQIDVHADPDGEEGR